MDSKLVGDNLIVNINGNRYELPVVPISSDTSIAVYDMLNNPDLVYDSAVELGSMVNYLVGWHNVDVIVTPECKCIPLAYQLAHSESKKLVVLRKSQKLYNPSTYAIEVKSITTDHIQELHLSRTSYEMLKGTKVLIVDDVISTGESLRAMEKLINRVPNVEIVGRAFVFSEGDLTYEEPVLTLGNLPLIKRS